MSKLSDIGLDFETYYDDEYTLKKLQTAQYILDPRFEIIGVSVKLGEGIAAQWITGSSEQIKDKLLELVPDWSSKRVVAHNARFDASILEWRLGVKAGGYFCTMVASRPFFVPYTGSQSLAAIAAYLRLGTKGDAVVAAKGKHRSAFSEAEMKAYGAYSCNDTELAWGIRNRLMPIMPEDEQITVDLTIRKYVRPRLMLDVTALTQRKGELEKENEDLLAKLQKTYGVSAGDIRSRETFAHLLNDHGASPPTKFNATGESTYAFAKTDPAFKALLAHPRAEVRELVAAKMKLSSTIEHARTVRLIDLAAHTLGRLPVPLVYYGAHTGRLSGDEKINLQNPQKVEMKDGVMLKGHIRKAMRAQPGYVVVAADLAAIEARIIATLAGQDDLVEAFKTGFDIYSEFASKIYMCPVNKKSEPLKRFVGKTCILGLGYGMGVDKFRLKMAQEGIIMDRDEAARIVYLYRETYPKIPALWKILETLATRIMTDPSGLYSWKCLAFAHERITR